MWPWAGTLSCEQEDTTGVSDEGSDMVSILLWEDNSARNVCLGGGEDSLRDSGYGGEPEECGAEVG